jgi:hypothetical protein
MGLSSEALEREEREEREFSFCVIFFHDLRLRNFEHFTQLD